MDETKVVLNTLFKINKIPIELSQFNNLVYLMNRYFKETNTKPAFLKIVRHKYKLSVDLLAIFFDASLNRQNAKEYDYIPCTGLTVADELDDIDLGFVTVCPETYF